MVQTNDVDCATACSKLDVLWEGARLKEPKYVTMLTEKANYLAFETEQGFATGFLLTL